MQHIDLNDDEMMAIAEVLTNYRHNVDFTGMSKPHQDHIVMIRQVGSKIYRHMISREKMTDPTSFTLDLS